MMEAFKNMTLVNPEALALLIIIPLGVWYYLRRTKTRYPYFRISSLDGLQNIGSWRSWLRTWLPILRGLAFLLFVIALARPQEVLKEEEIKAEGIDIFLVIDLSSSMLAQDFKPDRLEVSKKVAAEFVDKRAFDRIGLAVFAGEAFTQCPLTTDHRILKDFLATVKCGFLEDGTAIGMGLATAVNRIKNSEAKSKVVILLTDGVNNAGYIQPITAAEIAKTYGVKIYSIGAGSTGEALTPTGRLSNGEYRYGFRKVEIDEALLQKISELTGGRYFRATSAESLERIYEEIDDLEKTEMDVTSIKRYNENFRPFLVLGLIFLGIELLLKITVLRTLP